MSNQKVHILQKGKKKAVKYPNKLRDAPYYVTPWLQGSYMWRALLL